MSRPLIGITTYLAPASWGVWRDQPAALLPLRYVELVQRSGGTAVLLPPDDAPAAAAGTVARIDGLVVSGGPDVDPARYGQEPGPHTQAPALERDAWERALILTACEAGLPLLGICRGMQLLNVVLGGDLVQHLPDLVGHEDHSPTPGRYGGHPVVPVAGTVLAAVLGADKVDVPTYHHQAVRRIAPGLRASAHAFDGTVEAVEADGTAGTGEPPFLLGVQWHPEQGEDLRLTKALVQAAGSSKDDLHDRRDR